MNEKQKEYLKHSRFKPVPLLDGIEEIKQDFEERIQQGDTVYGIEILDDAVETIRNGSVTFIIAAPNCLDLNTNILTTEGFKKIKDITPNDKPLTASGKPTEIIGITETDIIDCYELETTDGRKVITSYNHKFPTYHYGAPNHNGSKRDYIYRDLTAEEISKELKNKFAENKLFLQEYNDISNKINKAQCVIKSCKKVEPRKTKCITVADDSHTIVVNNYLVTKNTGKSLMGQTIAVNLARQGKKVLICSCEMGAGLLMERQLKNLLGISMKNLRDLYTHQRDNANKLMDEIIENSTYDYFNNIEIAETGGATVEDIIKMLDVFPEFEYVVIDYIQRIRGNGTEYENITNAARELQTYARESKRKFIICSQANRQSNSDARDGKIIDPSKVRGKGSGSIEEDADVGLSLMEDPEHKGDKYILATLFKNRYGAMKNITYTYKIDSRLNLVLVKRGM